MYSAVIRSQVFGLLIEIAFLGFQNVCRSIVLKTKIFGEQALLPTLKHHLFSCNPNYVLMYVLHNANCKPLVKF